MKSLQIISLCALLSQVLAKTDYYYMQNLCNSTLYVDIDQVHLLFTSQRNMRCQFNIHTTRSKQLMLFFNEMCIEQTRDCQSIFLEIDDGRSRDDPFITGSFIKGGRLCSCTKPDGVFTTTGPYLTLYFQHDESFPEDQFGMVITPYHTGKCQNDEYECKNHRCIDQNLNCSPTASNPCGDWSNCVKKPPLSETNIIEIVAGCVGSVIIVAIVMASCYRRRHHQTRTTSSHTSSNRYDRLDSEQSVPSPPTPATGTSENMSVDCGSDEVNSTTPIVPRGSLVRTSMFASRQFRTPPPAYSTVQNTRMPPPTYYEAINSGSYQDY